MLLDLPVTVTVNSKVAQLEDESIAVYITWVVPTENALPGWKLLDNMVVTEPELSFAVGGVHVTTAVVEL